MKVVKDALKSSGMKALSPGNILFPVGTVLS